MIKTVEYKDISHLLFNGVGEPRLLREVIKDLCKENGCKLKEVGEEIDAGSYHSFLVGLRMGSVSAARLLRLADKFNVDVADLIRASMHTKATMK